MPNWSNTEIDSYIETALMGINQEVLPDGLFYCDIEECPGVWATGETLSECLEELRLALKGWLLLKIKDGDHIPILKEKYE